jgi:hypothetical protein
MFILNYSEMKYKSFILVSFLMFSLVELAQNRTLDSLQLIISKKINDTTHVKAMLNFSAMIRNSDLTKSIKLSTEALDLSQKLKFKKGYALANLNLGTRSPVPATSITDSGLLSAGMKLCKSSSSDKPKLMVSGPLPAI